ncbi:MAG: class I SAM-dependent methyltransferase [Acidimicrobiia bacterium]
MDRDKIESFLDRIVGFTAGTTTIGLLAIADRCGLSAYLGEHESGTADDIATGARLDQRYVTEILSGLAAAGVVEYEPGTGVFTLPPEHALFLSSELSPYFMGGWFDMLPTAMSQIDSLANATAHGGGVAFDEFGPEAIKSVDRLNGPSYRAFLTTRWLPGVPGLPARLQEGIRIADIGCGSGTAAILIAEAFPQCEVIGFDISSESISVARSRADGMPNVEFHIASATDVPPEPGFDFILTLDVIHDLVDPLAGLETISAALRQGGMYLMMEPNASSNLEDNLHDRGALLYGVSTMHCMTQSLAHGGAGLGTAWGRQTAEDLARTAGFGSFRPLDDLSNRFSAFYLLEN